MPNYNDYTASCFFRFAAISHGIKCRAIHGKAASAQAQQRADVLPELIEIAWLPAVRAGVQSGL